MGHLRWRAQRDLQSADDATRGGVQGPEGQLKIKYAEEMDKLWFNTQIELVNPPEPASD